MCSQKTPRRERSRAATGTKQGQAARNSALSALRRKPQQKRKRKRKATPKQPDGTSRGKRATGRKETGSATSGLGKYANAEIGLALPLAFPTPTAQTVAADRGDRAK